MMKHGGKRIGAGRPKLKEEEKIKYKTISFKVNIDEANEIDEILDKIKRLENLDGKKKALIFALRNYKK